MEILDFLETQTTHIANLKDKVLVAKKIQLHSGIEGFASPNAFGIYKDTGGKPLGVVGDVFEPTDLKLFLDAIEHSVLESGVDVDLNQLTYNEYGSKVVFRLPLKKYEIQSPMVGDALETAIEFRTGFDGKTKLSLGFFSYRLWCSNGAKNWQKDVDLAMKNTLNNQAKIMTFTNEIIKVVDMTNAHVNMLNNACLKAVTQKEIDAFMVKLTGADVKGNKEISTRQRNILDAINGAVAIEMQNTGANLFSLLQGVTRYTTHSLASNDMEKILYAKPSALNQTAHELVYAALN
jgi:hypothetical protein